MSGAADLLAAHLRQRLELGDSELIFRGQPLAGLRARRADNEEDVGGTGSAMPERSNVAARSDRRDPVAGVATPPTVVSLDSLQEVRAVAHECTACSLAASRTNVVFGEGNPEADLMVVGEAPGAEEDRTGRPFVGRAGRLLDKLLMSVGYSRETVYICNVLKCRPPQNRNPQPDEVESCNPFLRRQLALVRPRAILACGAFSARTLLDSTESIGRLRGGSHVYEGIPVVPTYHPAALLRNPAWIRPVWDDLQRLRALTDN